jgi:hypothetical protein
MLNQPFFQITLPLMVTFVATVWAASWAQNKRMDDLRDSINRRLDDIVARLTRIENLLADHDRRITALESSKWR